MRLNRDRYRSQVLGCWMGKNIGGTLGAPFEWRRQTNEVSFYTQDLGGQPLPNDDLDLQLLWLIALEEKGIEIDAHVLAEHWLLYVTPHWCEYGTAKVNLRAGLAPPLSGTLHNAYKHSCGAFIRSEIWACVAPGCPRIAARYALEDAIVDHGDGEGTYAEVFCAALESAAFVERDLDHLLRLALGFVPDDCGVAAAVQTALDAHLDGLAPAEARERILMRHRGGTHLGYLWCTSPVDRAKGFHVGELGYDAPSNVGLLVYALLHGQGDFAKTVCTAVNCGEDTDCTAATVGSLFGILNGVEAIPSEWIAPIGRSIKTACLNLGELGYFGDQLPAEVDQLTDRIERIAHQVLARWAPDVAIADAPEDLSGAEGKLSAADLRETLYRDLAGPRYCEPYLDIALDHGDGPYLRDGEPKSLSVVLTNKDKVALHLRLHWHTPAGVTVRPSADATVHLQQKPWADRIRLPFTVVAEHVPPEPLRLALELTLPGRPSVMLVPVTFLNGSLVS